ncbi:MAG: ribbon-helix-helix domain-containing protein [Promethearchaeota archaeon]
MSSTQEDIIWTIKINKRMDEAAQKVLSQLGYKSKAEFTREAIREFLIRRKLFSLLGGDVFIPMSFEYTPENALNALITQLERLSPDTLKKEVETARIEVEKELLNNG